MINMSDNTEVSKSFDWDVGYALFERSLNLELLDRAEGRCYVEGTARLTLLEAAEKDSVEGAIVFPDIGEAICESQASSHQSFRGWVIALDACVHLWTRW